MKPLSINAALALALAALPLAAAAQDTRARNQAAACAICHGTGGQAVTREVSSLAGLSREKIAAEMKAFRDGQRPATVMHQIAKGYNDQQIEAIAAWYAAQKH